MATGSARYVRYILVAFFVSARTVGQAGMQRVAVSDCQTVSERR